MKENENKYRQKSDFRIAKIFILTIVALLSACGQEVSNEISTSATIIIDMPKLKSSGLSSRALEDATVPGEITELFLIIKREDDSIVFDSDLLKIEGDVVIELEAGVAHFGEGRALAGEELLFSDEFEIAALRPGETRKVPIALSPSITVNISNVPEGFATVSSIVQVPISQTDGITLNSNIEGLKNPTLIWYVNDIEGGDDVVGTVDNDGLYIPPSSLPDNNIVVVKAVPVVAPSFAAQQSIEIIVDEPVDNVAPVSTITPKGGIYKSTQLVELSCDDCTAIHYTTNGTTPTLSSAVYSSAISVSVDTQIQFFAVDAAGNQEAVKTENYIIDTTVPTSNASPVGGIYHNIQNVTLSCDDCTAIHYTTNGTTPTLSSAVYSSAISVSVDTQIQFFAVDAAGNKEGINSETYTIDLVPPAPTGLVAAPGYTVIALSWDPSPGLNFQVWISESPNASVTGSLVTETSATSYTVTGLVNGQTYYLAVTAKYLSNPTGPSSPAIEVSSVPGITLSSLVFVDAALETCVLTSGATYVQQLTSLTCNNKGISNLAGIEQLTALQGLSLNGNTIHDISLIATLPGLKNVDLSNSHVATGVTALSALSNPVSIDLSNNSNMSCVHAQQLADFFAPGVVSWTSDSCLTSTPIAGLIFPDANLATCINQAATTVGAVYVSELTSLSCVGSSISDLSGITLFHNVTNLDLSNNSITDLAPLGEMTWLTVLSLKDVYESFTTSMNLGPLSTLVNLTELDLSGNWTITNLTPLAPLTLLTRLDLNQTNLTNLSPLNTLVNMQWLNLQGNNIVSLSGLETMSALTYLDLSQNDVVEIPAAVSWDNLDELKLEFNQVANISGLANAPNLRLAFLYENQISILHPLAGLEKLSLLSLGNNNVVDVRPISSLINIGTLSLQGNFIEDVIPLAGLSNLSSLNLNNMGTMYCSTANVVDYAIDGEVDQFSGAVNWDQCNSLRPIDTLFSLDFGLLACVIETGEAFVEDITILDCPTAEFAIETLDGISALSALVSFAPMEALIVDPLPLKNLPDLLTLDVSSISTVSCGAIEHLDDVKDGGDGSASGSVIWDTCTPVGDTFAFDNATRNGWLMRNVIRDGGDLPELYSPNPFLLLWDDLTQYPNFPGIDALNQNGSLTIATLGIVLPDEHTMSSGFWTIDVLSPELSFETNWQNFGGVNLRAAYQIGSKTISVQVLLNATRLSDGKPVFLRENDASGGPVFYNLNSSSSWHPSPISAVKFGDLSNYKINNIRLRIFGSQMSGPFKINFDEVTRISGP